MKKLIILILFSCVSVVANAQFVFKVDTVFFNNTLTKNTFTITGIHAKIVDGSEVALNKDFSKTLYLEYEAIRHSDSVKTFIGQQNATSQEIIEKLIKAGYSSVVAKEKVRTIFRNLEYGSDDEIYFSAYELAQYYSFNLKPKNQQDQ